jgi:hypothetical protein
VHSDGYPDGLGLDIAYSLLDSEKLNGWEVEYLDTIHTDLEYIYYIWQTPSKTTWISIFKTNIWAEEDEKCIFVGEPQQLIEKYEIKGDNLPF